MNILLYIFVAVTGALTSVEAGANTQMTKSFGGPWWAAVIFSVISLVLLGAVAAVLAGSFPSAGIAKLPWWGWIGGVVSAMYIVSMLVAPAKLGSGLFTGLTVSAAVLCSIALDNYGLVGFKVHPAGVGRLVGAALMVAGLACVAAF